MFESIIKLIDWIAEKLSNHVFPFVIVRDYEGGVILRLGRYLKTLDKGLNWKWPFVDEANTTLTSIDTFHIHEINITTRDNKTVVIGVAVEYQINDVKKFLIDVNDAISNAHDIARGVVSDILADYTWEEISGKSKLTDVKSALKRPMDDMGISVRRVYRSDFTITRVFTIFKA